MTGDGFRHVVDALQHWSARLGDAPAFVFRDRRHGRHVLSWARLHALSGRFAAVLKGAPLGLGRGHLVVNTLVNSPERALTEVGVMMSGAACVNASCQLADGSDLRHALSLSGARAVILDPEVRDSPWRALRKHVRYRESDHDVTNVDVLAVTSEAFPELRWVYLVRRATSDAGRDFVGRLDAREDWFQAEDLTGADTACVFSTSGSTGFSKLVVYSHSDLVRAVASMDDQAAFQTRSVMFNLSPLGWFGGSVSLTVLLPGATRVLCDVRAEAEAEAEAGAEDQTGAEAEAEAVDQTGAEAKADCMEDFVWRCLQEERCDTALIPPVYLQGVARLARGSHLNKKREGVENALEKTDPTDGGKSFPETTTQPDGVKNALDKTDPTDAGKSSSEISTTPDGVKNALDKTDPNKIADKTTPETAAPPDAAGVKIVSAPRPGWRPLPQVVLAGLPVTRALVLEARALADTVLVAYGSTDFGFISAMVVDAETAIEDLVDHDTGRPPEDTEVKIVSEEDEDECLPEGQAGLILVRKPGFTVEYLNAPEMTAAVRAPGGFLRTGDVGRLDARGHLVVEGRGGDAIMRGMYIFYPGWLEARIKAYPGVRDALVVGVPEPYGKEELCACLQLEEEVTSVEAVRDLLQRDIVARGEDLLSARPRYYLGFRSFPLTSTDKPMRRLVKERAARRLGLL